MEPDPSNDANSSSNKRGGWPLAIEILKFTAIIAVVLCGLGVLPNQHPTPAHMSSLGSIAMTSLVVGPLAGTVSWYFNRHPLKPRPFTRDEVIIWVLVIAVLVGVSALVRFNASP